MLHALMSPRTARTVRGLIGTLADAVRSVTNPAALVERQAEPAPAAEAPEPAGLYTADEMPELVAIERAALSLDLANDNARRADRAKRAARKILDRLPAGTYGNWIVERVASNRQVADLDAIRAIFKANGLGAIPMKDAQPSLKVRRAEIVPTIDAVETLTAVTV